MRWRRFENVRRVRGNYGYRAACAAFRFDRTRPGIAIDIWNHCSAITCCQHIRRLGTILEADAVTAIPASEAQGYRVVYLLEPCVALREDAAGKALSETDAEDYLHLGYRFCDGNRDPVPVEEVFEADALGAFRREADEALEECV